MSYQDVLGQLPETPIGHDFDPSRPVESFLLTARAAAFQPKAFFAALPRQGNYRAPLVFALICAEASAVLSGLLGIGAHNFGWLIGLLVATAVGATVGLFIVAAIAHLLVTLIVGPTNAGFAATFQAAAYASVTDLASWIPVVGGLVALYGIYLAIVGIREVHRTTTGKAALVVLIPVAVVGVLVLLVVFVAGVALIAGLAH
jgi:hypothetical protein